MTDEEWFENKVEEYNQRVYAGQMSAHSKGVYRDWLKKEDDFWMRQAIRQDSNTGPDDQ